MGVENAVILLRIDCASLFIGVEVEVVNAAFISLTEIAGRTRRAVPKTQREIVPFFRCRGVLSLLPRNGFEGTCRAIEAFSHDRLARAQRPRRPTSDRPEDPGESPQGGPSLRRRGQSHRPEFAPRGQPRPRAHRTRYFQSLFRCSLATRRTGGPVPRVTRSCWPIRRSPKPSKRNRSGLCAAAMSTA